MTQDADCSSHPDDSLHIPDLTIFQQLDPLSSYSSVSKAMKCAINQKQLTVWYIFQLAAATESYRWSEMLTLPTSKLFGA